MGEETKVYVVKKGFEYDGLIYADGEKYELAVSTVSKLPEGSVEEFVQAPETTATSEAGVDTSAPAEEKKESVPAKPWVGGHTVGKD